VIRVCPWCHRYARLHTAAKALDCALRLYGVADTAGLQQAVEAEMRGERPVVALRIRWADR
jgi:hypothetical protein